MLCDVDIVQKFIWTCNARKNGANRTYNLFLVIGQALKFTASRTGASPEDALSWSLVSQTQKQYRTRVQREHNAASVLPPKFPLLEEGDYESLRDKCTVFLRKTLSLSQVDKRKRVREYMDHVILLTLISVATPRHQIFSLMEYRHLVWLEDEGCYQILFDGSNPPLKNGKAILLLLPTELSVFYKVSSLEFLLFSYSLGLVADNSSIICGWLP